MKKLWNNRNKRRGLIATIVVHAALLLLFLFVGLKYYDPKPEDGIVINFGTSETGQGEIVKEASSAPAPSESSPSESASQSESPQDETSDPAATQDVTDAPALDAKSSEEEKDEKDEKKDEKKSEEKTQDEPEPEPEPSESLKKLLQNTENSQQGGEGVTEGPGDQGDPDGDKNSPNRSGQNAGGGGGGGNYQLGDRRALEKPRPDYPCSAEGRVVVKIYVDRQGNVQRAVAGERVPGGAATTTSSSCLFRQAESAALRTTWQADSEAPDSQTGYIIYNFYKS